MPDPIRILYLEDDPRDAALVKTRLEEAGVPCAIHVVDTRDVYMAAINRGGIDLILADYKVPGYDGMQALAFAKEHCPGVPFIFVTGTMGDEKAAMTIRLGAVDYLLKDRLERLPDAVTRGVNEAEAATARKRMGESMKLYAVRMKSIMDTLLDAIIVMDDHGVIQDWNARAESMFGWSKTEALGRSLAETIIPPGYREAHQRGLERFLATGEGRALDRRIEITGLHRTGREFPAELAVTATKVDGRWQFTGFIIDTTEHKRAEKELKWFRTLLDNVKDSIEVIDPQTGKFLDGNEKAWSNLGYTCSELLSLTVPEIDPLVTSLEFAKLVQRLRETGEALVLESIHLRKDRTTFPVEVSAQLIRQDEQDFLVAIVRDITERKRAERRLAAQYAVTQVLVESPTLKDADAKILQVLCECLGWEVGGIWKVDRDANLLRCLEIWHDPKTEAAEFVADSRQRTFAPGVGMPGRVWSHGEPVWISDVLKDPNFPRAPVAAKAGLHAAIGFPIKLGQNVYGIIEFFSREIREPDVQALQMVGDIGIKIGHFIERKEAEDTLRERDLAKLTAEQANRAKSEFLSRMSHELRTPLNAILGFAQLLDMDSLTPGQHESIARILHGGKHLLDLINEVLDISRIEAGRLDISLEPVLIQECMCEALDLVRPMAAQRHVELRADKTKAEGVCVYADRQRLRQVALNLLSNAVKYNREGGAVTLACATTAEGRVRISVTDTGPGISPEKLARLFTPFERLGAEQAGIEGTGLGLSLSKRLAEAMHGTLGVESTVGRGSSFWIELQAAQHQLAASDSRSESAATGKAVPSLRSARTLLCIEDNLSNLALIEKLLAGRPEITLLSAMQGQMGMDLARQHKPDLILLDLHLPDLRGEEVLLQLKADSRTREIPVIVLSADATKGQIERLLASGAHAYLTKPLDLKQLLVLFDEKLA